VVAVNGAPATTGLIYITSGVEQDVLATHAPDAAGGFTFTTTDLAVGRHEISARYSQFGTPLAAGTPASPMVPVTIVAAVPFGSFTLPMAFADACGASPVLADLNGDGILDHATACLGANEARVRMGNGDGTFQSAIVLSTGTHVAADLAAADITNDGRKDLIVLGAQDSQYGQVSISSFRNLGDGAFAAPVVSLFGGWVEIWTARLTLIDADGTRIADIAMAVGDRVIVASSAGTGTFTARFTTPSHPDVTALATGDVNGDGYHDFAFSARDYSTGEHSLFVYKGTSTYGYTATASGLMVPGEENGLVIEDFNGDGRGDVVSTQGRMWPGQADGSLGTPYTITTTGGTTLVSGEFNGDAPLDAMTATKFLPGNIAGGFAAAIGVPIDAARFAIGDLDNDGRLDVVTAGAAMLMKFPPMVTLTVSGTPGGSPALSMSATVSGLNGPAAGGTVTFRLAGGSLLGVVPVDASGQATLTPANWGSIGSWTLLAEFSGDAIYGRAWDSEPLTISALPSVLTINAPASAMQGETIYLSAGVALMLPYAPTGTLTISIDGQPVKSGDPQFLQHSVALTAGDHTITAVYSGDSRFVAATTTRLITVNAVRTRTVLSAPGGSLAVGGLATLSAKVYVLPPANGTPTGSVTFTDGDQVIATVPLTAGIATHTATLATPGLHHFHAAYVPDTPQAVGSQSGSVVYSAIHGGAGGGLRRAIDFPTAGSGGFVQVGDLNEDGRLDAIVAQDTVMSVFLANSDLSFQSRIDYVLPDTAKGLAVMDVDSDGHTDVFVPLAANATDFGLRTFYGDGTGAFTRIFNTESQGRNITAAAVGELSDDGYPDVAAAMLNTFPQVRIIDVTRPGGGLQGPYVLPVALAIGDITGDSYNDVVVADRDSLIMLIWGQQIRQQIQLDVYPTAVSLADLNHDGRADVIVSSYTYEKRFVMLANGTGGFGAPVWIDEGSHPDPTVADIDADGNPDLLELDGSHLVVMRGNGDGTFGARRSYGFAPGSAMTMADLNGDGFMDVITVGDALHVIAGAAGVTMSVTSNHGEVVPARAPVTVTASIAALHAGDGTPSGPIHFRAVLVTAESVNEWTADVLPVDGVASFTNVYPTGWLSITAEYDGDATFGANGGTVDHFVLYAPPNTPPTLTLPASFVVEADRRGGALVTYTATAFDAEDGPLVITCAKASGKKFLIGTTTVTCRATDSDLALTTGSFTVTVVDTTAPEVTFRNNREPYEAHQNVNIRCVAKDVASEITATTCVDTVGPAYTFALGVNTITATATDAVGNIGQASTSFTVVVTIASLKNLVRDFSTNDVVTKELIQKLNKNQLAAFKAQVQAQSGLAFTIEQAATLLRLAQ
jgi:hypothetical protein